MWIVFRIILLECSEALDFANFLAFLIGAMFLAVDDEQVKLSVKLGVRLTVVVLKQFVYNLYSLNKWQPLLEHLKAGCWYDFWSKMIPNPHSAAEEWIEVHSMKTVGGENAS